MELTTVNATASAHRRVLRRAIVPDDTPLRLGPGHPGPTRVRSLGAVTMRPPTIRSRSRRFAALVASIALAAVGCRSGDGDGTTAFPSVDLVDVSGDAVSTASWNGEPLVVNFWYSTCVPCTRELREFADVDAERGDEVRFIGVNPLDSPAAMVEFAAERGVEYDLFQDSLAELQTELEISAFPRTYFVTSDGAIHSSTGVLDADGLRTEIDALLAADQA